MLPPVDLYFVWRPRNKRSLPQTLAVDTMLVYCWASVADAGPAVNQHCVSVSWMLGYLCKLNNMSTIDLALSSEYKIYWIAFWEGIVTFHDLGLKKPAWTGHYGYDTSTSTDMTLPLSRGHQSLSPNSKTVLREQRHFTWIIPRMFNTTLLPWNDQQLLIFQSRFSFCYFSNCTTEKNNLPSRKLGRLHRSRTPLFNKSVLY